MDGETASRILTNTNLVLPLKSEKDIVDTAKTVFLEEYDRLMEQDPELEEKVFRVKGLMSQLLMHRKKKVKN
jgi:hypothetical protein